MTYGVGRRKLGLFAPYITAGILSASLVAIGTNVDWRLITPIGARAIATACTQLGSLGLVVTAVLLLLFLLSAKAPKRVLTISAKAMGFVLTMFFIGEVFTRLVYYDGMSFSSRAGPIVSRFERSFKFNRYDGPSRGPEIRGPRGPSEVRILFQGDSITWGQGVKDEDLLYTNRLLARLRSEDLDVEAAVLAKPGRELDGHLAQLRKWGAEIQPDIIVYQWFINDMELNKANRPRTHHIWQYAFFHPLMLRISYLWFLLDYRIGLALGAPMQSYQDYIREYYGVGTEGWAVFAELFRVWAAEAKQITPRVVVMLYSWSGPQDVVADFVSRLVDLCQEEGVAAVDLSPWIEQRFTEDYTAMFASQFDSHPNASVHGLMAEVLYSEIKVLWPERFTY